ncbi:MAG: anhydro-N-acetylmuramic acid kinase [Holosporales bacterium]|jgi:anhydro-N-acetylmuramic acid kinase|nr:anhydro-N-acetylmuramic acid kinase [Holosporales bacterium]
MESLWALGIAGDMDGAQVSLIFTNGCKIVDFGMSLYLPYSGSLRKKLFALQRSEHLQATAPLNIRELSEELSCWFAQASQMVIDKVKEVPSIIGLYGQPIQVRGRAVRYVGAAEILANKLKIPTVYDFHATDISAGGNGAFIGAPYYQGVFLAALEKKLLRNCAKIAVIDASNAAQVTIVSDEELIAFEAGPGMSLINEFTQHVFQADDTDGRMGGRGEINCSVLNQWCRANKTKPVPAALCDVDKFIPYTKDCYYMTPLDGVATLTAFVSQLMENAIGEYSGAKTAILIGTSAQNSFLKSLLSRSLVVLGPKDISWNYQFEQSEQAAYNAVRFLNAQPISFEATTGVSLVCGRLVMPFGSAAA